MKKRKTEEKLYGLQTLSVDKDERLHASVSCFSEKEPLHMGVGDPPAGWTS
jgi:hypothetical protein